VKSRWARYAFLLAALAFCAYGLITQWSAIESALSTLSAWTLLRALAAGMIGLFCWMLGWRALLAGFGVPLPIAACVRIMFLGQLGKYVPGSVWAVVGQVSLAREHGVPRPASGSATVVAMATTIATGCATAALTLPLASTSAARDYWWALLLAPILLACLHPRVVTWGLNTALRLVRQEPLSASPSLGGMTKSVLWTLLGWLFFGLHTWVLMPSGSALLATGAYSLAYVVGFLVIFAPGGLGAREVALTAALAPALSQPAALVVALSSRVLLTMADLLWAAIGNTMPKPAVPVEETAPQD